MPRRDVRTVPIEQVRLPFEPTASEAFEAWYLGRMDWARLEREIHERHTRFQQIAGMPPVYVLSPMFVAETEEGVETEPAFVFRSGRLRAAAERLRAAERRAMMRFYPDQGDQS